VVPLAGEFSPQLVLVSAGYDAHAEDPLADCQVTDAGYASMTRSLREAAGSLGVAVGAVLEGGYALDALARSVVATREVLRGGDGLTAGLDEPDVAREAERARGRLAEFWPGLG
jgi:acetoin utilization deacetylase AcuC-like enzyme